MNQVLYRRRSASSVVVFALIGAYWCSASPVQAASVVLDQSAPSRSNAGDWSLSFGTRELGQTFAVSFAGYLESIDLYVNRQQSSIGLMHWDVRTAVAGLPALSESLIHASGTIPIADLPRYWDRNPISLDLSPFEIKVQPSQQYAITIHVSDGGNAFWLYSLSQPLGRASNRSGSTTAWEVDTFYAGVRGYATYVRLIPEPTTTVLFAVLVPLGVAPWQGWRGFYPSALTVSHGLVACAVGAGCNSASSSSTRCGNIRG